MKNNRLLILVFALVMCLGLTACNEKQSKKPEEEQQMQQPEQQTLVENKEEPQEDIEIIKENKTEKNEERVSSVQKKVIRISQSKAIISKEVLLQNTELILRARINEKTNEVMTNPKGTRKDANGEIFPNEQIGEYEVEVLQVYKGKYEQDTIMVKTTNGYGLSPDLILKGEDETSVLEKPLYRFDLQVGKECILMLTYSEQASDEATGYYVKYGQQGCFLKNDDGTFQNKAPVENIALRSETLKDDILKAVNK